MKKNKKLWIYSVAILGFVFILMNGCKKDESNDVTVAIGDSYQGGKVAYILVSGDPGYVAGETHGLIAAPNDQSTRLEWFNGTETVTGATATALGTGNDNTVTIINNQGDGNYAAKLCSDLVLGGYDDWFLPSKDELTKLYLNKVEIGGFAEEWYWSSSEVSYQLACQLDFNYGQMPDGFKYFNIHVRAIRYF